MAEVTLLATADPALAAQSLLGAFSGSIEPVRCTLLYRLGLVVVAPAMLLLIAVYLACLVGLVWVIGHFLIILIERGDSHSHPTGLLSLFLLVLLFGGILLVFLVKPLFAPRPPPASRVVLDITQEAMLLAFVERICTIVKAPVPAQIAVDLEVNASAGFRRGVLGMVGGELVLTIGLPLIVGLNQRQLAGILAHEFGHFSQGAGMRVSTLIRMINGWFARVVYQRDRMDQAIDRWARGGFLWIMVMVWLAKAGIWFSRRVLWALMHLGHALSSFLSRQMEFDADRYSARLVGCEVQAATGERVELLKLAQAGALGDMRRAWNEGRLADDLPALICANLALVPAETYSQHLAAVANAPTRWFDSHPNITARNASSRREGTAGIFLCEAPASDLFMTLLQVSRRATELQYRTLLGREFDPGAMVPTSQLISDRLALVAGESAARRVFQGISVSLFFPAFQASLRLASEQCEPLLRSSHAALATALLRRDGGVALVAADTALIQARRAQELLLARAPISASEFGLARARLPEVEALVTQRLAERASALAALAENAELVGRHGGAALALLGHARLDAVLSGRAEYNGQGAYLSQALTCLANAFPSLEHLRDELNLIHVLLPHLVRKHKRKAFQNRLRMRLHALCQAVIQSKTALGSATYPFLHAGGGLTISAWAVPNVPPENNPNAVIGVGIQALERAYGLLARLLGELALLIERVEAAMGLAQLLPPTTASALVPPPLASPETSSPSR